MNVYLRNYKGEEFGPFELKNIHKIMKIPHRCPVCNGQGLVQNGFYQMIGVDSYPTTSATPEQCKSCTGTGIVWNEEIPHL